MNNREHPNDRGADVEEDDRLAETLSLAGRRGLPSETQMERWTGQFSAVLEDVRAEKRRSWRVRAAGIAAYAAGIAATVAAVVALLLIVQAPDAPVAAEVASIRVVFGGNRVDAAEGGQRSLVAGDGLNVGDRLRTGLRGGLGMNYRGADVRLGPDTELVVHATRLELISGVVYVDTGAADPALTDVVVATRLGSVTHLGTQFIVQLESDQLVSGVREGQIIFRSENEKRQLSANGSTAAKINVSEDGAIVESRESRTGDLWDWAVELSPGISLDGRSPDDILTWAARESGRTLEYASEAAAAAARAGRLTGTDAKLRSPEALAAVQASTRLRFVPADPATLLVDLGNP